MSFELSFENLTNSLAALTAEQALSIESDIRNHLQINGRLPCSLSVREQAAAALASSQVVIADVERIIMADPLLALRLLALVNSSYYRRGGSIHSVSGALAHLGVKRLLGSLSDISDAKNYGSAFRGRAVSAGVLEETLLAGTLAGKLASLMMPQVRLTQPACLVSSLVGLTLVAWAFARPNVYSAFVLDSLASSKKSFDACLEKFLGKSRYGIALSLAQVLALPEELVKVVTMCLASPWKKVGTSSRESKDVISTAAAVHYGLTLAHALCEFEAVEAVDNLIREIASRCSMNNYELKHQITEIVPDYCAQAQALGLGRPRIPPYLALAIQKSRDPDKLAWLAEGGTTLVKRIDPYLHELKACFGAKRSAKEFCRLPQAALCTLQALLKGLNFSRAVLFRFDLNRDCLVPIIMLGEKVELFGLRSVSGGGVVEMPDVQAFRQKRAIFQGKAVIEDGWPFMAFPVVWQGRSCGVFYADKIGGRDPLETQEQVACIALAEAWGDVPTDFA